jgi:hypothetical protein
MCPRSDVAYQLSVKILCKAQRTTNITRALCMCKLGEGQDICLLSVRLQCLEGNQLETGTLKVIYGRSGEEGVEILKGCEHSKRLDHIRQNIELI